MTFIGQPSASVDKVKQRIPRDSDGFSSALRLAWYTTRLTKPTDILLHGTEDDNVTACRGLVLVLQLAADSLSVSSPTSLWEAPVLESEVQVVDFIVEAQGVLASWLQRKDVSVPIVQEHLLKGCYHSSTASYYNARAYSAIATEIMELHGHVSSHGDNDLVQQVRKSRGSEFFFSAMAILTSAPDSNQLTRLANELLADLTGHDFFEENEKGKHRICNRKALILPRKCRPSIVAVS